MKKEKKNLTSKLESKTLFPFLYKAKRETGKSNAKRRELFTHCLSMLLFACLLFNSSPKGIQPFELEKLFLLLHLPYYTFSSSSSFLLLRKMKNTKKFHHMKIFHLLA
jgi:hypothetical protein